MKEIKLKISDCTTATQIQSYIDSLTEGGSIIFPETLIDLDRSIELRDGVQLIGQGEKTIFRKKPFSKTYTLKGQHCEGLYDVHLYDTQGLKPGMTVTITCKNAMGFDHTFTKITWVDKNHIGIERPLSRNFFEENQAILTFAFSIIDASHVKNAALLNFKIDGNRSENPHQINGCRGAAIYLNSCQNIEIDSIIESNFNGDGLSYQSCYDIRVSNSSFSNNHGQGFHPGAGTTKSYIRNCIANNNEYCGFFFCVRANHIDVHNCTFQDNHYHGISIGQHDSHNHIKGCNINRNKISGIFFRSRFNNSAPHACLIEQCKISENLDHQIFFREGCYDITLKNNLISANDSKGIEFEAPVRTIYFQDNELNGITLPQSDFLTQIEPKFSCGYKIAESIYARHLNIC